jgi:hypothetical protein
VLRRNRGVCIWKSIYNGAKPFPGRVDRRPIKEESPPILAGVARMGFDCGIDPPAMSSFRWSGGGLREFAQTLSSLHIEFTAQPWLTPDTRRRRHGRFDHAYDDAMLRRRSCRIRILRDQLNYRCNAVRYPSGVGQFNLAARNGPIYPTFAMSACQTDGPRARQEDTYCCRRDATA